MMAKLTLEISTEILKLLAKERAITIKLTGGTSGPKPAASDHKTPRPGSWMAKIIAWAEERGRPFGAPDLLKRFKKLTRGHASMLLTKLTSGGYPIRRLKRGVYRFKR